MDKDPFTGVTAYSEGLQDLVCCLLFDFSLASEEAGK